MKTNYKNYNRGNRKDVKPVDEVVEETKEIIGVVSNCEKLNVRSNPDKDSDVLYTLNKGNEVMIDKEASTSEFYKVITGAGLEGYCMKQFIEVEE